MKSTLATLAAATTVNGCFEHVDYPGNDIKVSDNIHSAEACQAICRETDGCSTFTWSPSEGFCWSKTVAAGRLDHDGRVSGPAFCGESSGMYHRFLVAHSCEEMGFHPILDEARCVEAVQQLGVRVVGDSPNQGSIEVHHDSDERPPGCFEYTAHNEAPSKVEFNRNLDSTFTSPEWKDLYVICAESTPEPTANPTESPTDSPTPTPSAKPTPVPTNEPTHPRIDASDAYVLAFQTTGCPNNAVHPSQVTFWKSVDKANAFSDMHTLCRLTKEGHAAPHQRDACCSDGVHCMPTSCDLQTDLMPECVFCPQVVPECDFGCENCERTQQTCESCPVAMCLDEDTMLPTAQPTDEPTMLPTEEPCTGIVCDACPEDMVPDLEGDCCSCKPIEPCAGIVCDACPEDMVPDLKGDCCACKPNGSNPFVAPTPIDLCSLFVLEDVCAAFGHGCEWVEGACVTVEEMAAPAGLGDGAGSA